MDNSLLDVRDINHKYIVVEGMKTKDVALKLDCSKSLVCEVYKRYREKKGT